MVLSPVENCYLNLQFFPDLFCFSTHQFSDMIVLKKMRLTIQFSGEIVIVSTDKYGKWLELYKEIGDIEVDLEVLKELQQINNGQVAMWLKIWNYGADHKHQSRQRDTTIRAPFRAIVKPSRAENVHFFNENQLNRTDGKRETGTAYKDGDHNNLAKKILIVGQIQLKYFQVWKKIALPGLQKGQC